jgi:hypothetical protein
MKALNQMRYPITAAAALIVAAAVTGSLSGCTSSAPTPTPTATAPAAGAQLDVPTSVPNVPADRPNVLVQTCSAASGGWSAKGTAHNPGTKSVTYTINVFFTNQTATVVGVASTRVGIAPGKTKPWVAAAQIAGASNLRCVLRGVG